MGEMILNRDEGREGISIKAGAETALKRGETYYNVIRKVERGGKITFIVK